MFTPAEENLKEIDGKVDWNIESYKVTKTNIYFVLSNICANW